MVVLYSAPGCAACAGTERFLTYHGIEFEKVDISENDEARQKVKSLGYSSMPVVYYNESTHWSGLKLGEIKKLAVELKAPQTV